MSEQSKTKKPSALSCQECRRSKLKCDRVFPCQSCIRRGCADICPDGTMAPVKGNKVLEAHAGNLEEQIKMLQQRVRELEQQLVEPRNTSLPQRVLSNRYPLDALIAPSSEAASSDASPGETVSDISVGLGSLSIGEEGQVRYHGETASSEYFQELLHTPERAPEFAETALNLPPEIMELLKFFPMGQREYLYTPSTFNGFLPLRPRALDLIDLYYEHSTWFYDPLPRQDFMETIFAVLYPDEDNNLPNLELVEDGCPHILAVFFMLLAYAIRHDPDTSDIQTLSAHYIALAKASYSLACIANDVTTNSVTFLFLYNQLLYVSDRNSTEERWFMSGLANRAAQTIGLRTENYIKIVVKPDNSFPSFLERDSSKWNLSKSQIQCRRVLLFEMFLHDCWQSLVLGRAPALLIQHTDCRFPDIIGNQVSFHDWAWRFAASCLSPAIEHIFTTIPMSYHTLLEIDKGIRKFPIPAHLRAPVHADGADLSWSTNQQLAMQQCCTVTIKESTLLSIHRSYFAAAASQNVDPLKHIYGPSVLAAYRSANKLIASMNGLMDAHPEPAGSCWFFWSGVFSACIVLGALVVEAPTCSLATDALAKLEETVPFFQERSQGVATPGIHAMLDKLLQRAQAAFKTGKSYRKPPQDGAEADELAILGGRHAVIQPKPNPYAAPFARGPKLPTAAEMEVMMDFYEGRLQRTSSSSSSASTSSPSTLHSAGESPWDPFQSATAFDSGVGMDWQPHYDNPTFNALGQLQPQSLFDPFSTSPADPMYQPNAIGPIRHRQIHNAALIRTAPYPTQALHMSAGESGTSSSGWTGVGAHDPAAGPASGYVDHEAVWKDFKKNLGME